MTNRLIMWTNLTFLALFKLSNTKLVFFHGGSCFLMAQLSISILATGCFRKPCAAFLGYVQSMIWHFVKYFFDMKKRPGVLYSIGHRFMLFKALNQGNDSVNCFVFILDLLLLGVQKQKWHLRKVMGLWLGSLARSNLMVPRSLYFVAFRKFVLIT